MSKKLNFKRRFLNILTISLFSVAGIMGIGSAIVDKVANETSTVDKADAVTSAAQTYYYCNFDRYDGEDYHSCQWGWWDATYDNIWLQYSIDGGTNWSYAAAADMTTTTITLGSETINVKRWKYFSGATNFQWYCWNTGSPQNRAENISVSGIVDGKNVYCVNSYEITNEQSGYWLYYVGNTTTKRTYYLDASNWGVTESTTGTVALHWWDPNNSTTVVGDVIATEYYADNKHFYKFYAAELTGDYYFMWYFDSWSKKTAVFNPYSYDCESNNLCIASSTNEQVGDWVKTNGIIQKMHFYSYAYNTPEWINTYYLFNGENFNLSGVSLPSESKTGWVTPTAWNEDSFDGIERSTTYVYENVDRDYSLYATYLPGGGTVIPNDKVRLWVTYYNSENSSGDYFDYGDSKTLVIVLWIHSTKTGGSELLYSSENTSVWHTYNNSSQEYRRYDYFDIDLSCYTNGWYLTIQRLDPDSKSNWGQTSNDDNHCFQLTSNNVGKVHSICWDSTNSVWYISDIAAGTGSATVDAQLATRALAGLHTCSDNVYNGSKAFNNTRDTFLNPNGGSTWYTNGNISDWYIYDFDKGNTSYDTDYESLGIDGYIKYQWLNYYCNGGSMPSPALGNFDTLHSVVNTNSTIDASLIIVVVVSSVALLSITALSILVVKKKKEKQ